MSYRRLFQKVNVCSQWFSKVITEYPVISWILVFIFNVILGCYISVPSCLCLFMCRCAARGCLCTEDQQRIVSILFLCELGDLEKEVKLTVNLSIFKVIVCLQLLCIFSEKKPVWLSFLPLQGPLYYSNLQ